MSISEARTGARIDVPTDVRADERIGARTDARIDVRSGARAQVRTGGGGGGGVKAGAGGETGARAGEDASGGLGPSRAARELHLKRGEFELATQLGHIRTEVGTAGGRRRVSRREIERLRAAEGFPDGLRQRVRTVGTAEGSALMSVSPGRFTRLARAGLVAPVTFYLNRYRTVVWLYLADELRACAAGEPRLRLGRLPRGLCAGVDESDDRRPRNWRGRRIGHLLHESEDPWERVAVVGCVLDAAHLAELVRDPYERAYLNRLAPALFRPYPESEAARSTVGRLLLADHPDEIAWHRASLETFLAEARRARPAPRAEEPTTRAEGAGPPLGGPLGGLLTRLRARRERGPGPVGAVPPHERG
ncbi:DUF6397 family protein [Streptomyces sp. NPDC096310]|uniref:DUF6397 family protein n=1 Tax=Streptomyces sp. NPDC096310 TaxID=3366082 RepID=UPI00380690A9